MTTIIKEIAKRALGLSEAYCDRKLHERNYIVADEWHCSLGDREDKIGLFRWSAEKGFKAIPLPYVEIEAYAWGCGLDKLKDVPYYDQKVLSLLDKGYYVLVYVEDIPSWDNSDREPMMTFDVFEV